jgi:hypothetical protein
MWPSFLAGLFCSFSFGDLLWSSRFDRALFRSGLLSTRTSFGWPFHESPLSNNSNVKLPEFTADNIPAKIAIGPESKHLFDPLPLPIFRHLRCHLRVAHPLLAVEIFQHLDRGPHVGGELEDAYPLGDPHRGVGMPERVGDPLLAIGCEQET